MDPAGVIPSRLPPRQLLTDGVVTLRAPDSGDIDDYARSASDPAIVAFTHVPLDFGRDGAARFVAAAATAWESGEMARFAVTSAAAPAQLVGSISLVHLDWATASADVGFWLLPEARGRGLAKHAVHLVTSWAFDVVGLSELRAEVFEGNDASWHVLMTNGFHEVGDELITHRGSQRRQRLAARRADGRLAP